MKDMDEILKAYLLVKWHDIPIVSSVFLQQKLYIFVERFRVLVKGSIDNTKLPSVQPNSS